VQESPEEASKDTFVKHVLAGTEDVWGDLFQRMGKRYRQPKLVHFTGNVNSACGLADAAVGLFYCPGDEKVYSPTGPRRPRLHRVAASSNHYLTNPGLAERPTGANVANRVASTPNAKAQHSAVPCLQ
jgi:hypothetical protein